MSGSLVRVQEEGCGELIFRLPTHSKHNRFKKFAGPFRSQPHSTHLLVGTFACKGIVQRRMDTVKRFHQSSWRLTRVDAGVRVAAQRPLAMACGYRFVASSRAPLDDLEVVAAPKATPY